MLLHVYHSVGLPFPVLFSVNRDGGWPSPHLPEKKQRMEAVIFPISSKKPSGNGGGHPSLFLWQAPVLT